jgi:AsmA protein
MKFNWKTIAIGLGGLVGVLVLAAVLFIAFFPKELAAREAERRIEEATRRDLVLGDAIDVSFWPALGFSVEQASLSNPEGFATEHPFIAADKIVFAVALLPLLRGDIQVRELIFEGADLRLITGAEEGAANWAFPTENTQDEDGGTIEDLRLDDVRLTNGRISFQGAQGDALVLENVDASLALDSLDTPATLNAAFDYLGERLNVESTIGAPRAVLEKGETPFGVRVRAAPINASFNGAFQVATGALAGRIEADGASVRRLLAWIGSPMGEGGGFGAFRVAGQMAHVGERTELNEATFRLDAIEARGNLAIVALEDRPLRIEGALSAGDVDLNPYLPAPAQSGDAGVNAESAWSDAPLDLSGLRALDANLALTLEGLRFQKLSFQNVALALRVANGAADARLTRIALYGGAGTARLIADGSGATPRVAVELNANDIQAEPLLRDAVGFDSIVGRGRLTASLVGQGGTQAALMRSLRGDAAFNFNDGQWKGVNLAQIGRAVQAIRGEGTITGDGQGNATDFAELAATFAVIDGAAATQDLRLLNPYVRLTGAGIVNIGAQTIDMRLEPRAVQSAQGQGGNAADTGYGIPFRVRGPWARVSFQPAVEEIVQNELRNIIAREARENPDNPLSQIAGALFGNQAETPTPTPTTAEGAPAQTPAAEGQAPAQQPAQQEQQQPSNPLGDFLRRAAERERERQEQQPEAEKQGE